MQPGDRDLGSNEQIHEKNQYNAEKRSAFFEREIPCRKEGMNVKADYAPCAIIFVPSLRSLFEMNFPTTFAPSPSPDAMRVAGKCDRSQQ